MNNISAQSLIYLKKQGYFHILSHMGCSYYNDRLEKQKEFEISTFENANEAGIYCLNQLTSMAKQGLVDFSGEDSNNFELFVRSAKTFDFEIKKGTDLYDVLSTKAQTLFKSLDSSSGYGTYGNRSIAQELSKLISIVPFYEEDQKEKAVSSAKNMIKGICDIHKYSFGYFSGVLSGLVSFLAKEDYDYLKENVVKTVKSNKAHVRSSIFKGLIDSGKLDKKTARKIRSDASESVSLECVQYLFQRRIIYSELDFKKLFTQFGDSKYSSVTIYLAKTVDPKHLNILMGSDCYETKRIMRSRMDEYYKELEEKKTNV